MRVAATTITRELSMKAVRFAVAGLILALSCIAQQADGASYSSDQSDLWWADPPYSESGWGIEFVQRGSTIFATMFVYGSAGTPTWYVAVMDPASPGSMVWSGDLIATTGPWFGTVPFNPALVTQTKVGTMTWAPANLMSGTLSYTANGIEVTKNLTRQTLVNESYSGHFGGALHQDTVSCASSDMNGTREQAGVLDIVQSGTAVTITTSPATGASCTYSGTLTQYGQMGDIAGSFSCSDGSSGSFDAFEVQVTEFSVSGRFTSAYAVPAGCEASGWFSGLTVTTY